MKEIHDDKSFSHTIHIVLMLLTFGAWVPVWLTRWQMHKTDRLREAIRDIARHLENSVSVTTPPNPPTPQPPPTHEIATASGPMNVTRRPEPDEDDHEDEDIPTFKWRPKGEQDDG